MKITNDTLFAMRTTRDYPSDELGQIDAVTRVVWEINTDSTTTLARDQAVDEATVPWPAAELGGQRDYVELMVHGTITPPPRAPRGAQFVRLRVGPHEQRLHAYGPRHWLRSSAGTLIPSESQFAQPVEMAWPNAFGGSFRRPPGLIPSTELPGPSTELAWAPNKNGVGFYITEEEAEGNPLPQLEDPDHPITRWDDRPTPACWARLPEDSSLHMDHWGMVDGKLGTKGAPWRSPLADALAVAPPCLRFSELGAGDPISLTGFTDDPLELAVPDAPFQWRVTVGDRARERQPRLCMIVLLPNQRRAALFYRTRMGVPLVRRLVREGRQVASAAASAVLMRDR